MNKINNFNDLLLNFQHQYCDYCGSQRCGGVYDELFREGCEYYQKEFLKIDEVNELVNISCNKNGVF